LADVRTLPRSRRHPHFSAEALARSLAAADIEYRHFPRLGGLRKPRRDSVNTAWTNDGFRGYADYMETEEFDQALEELLRWSSVSARGGAPRAVITCAEAVWWQCHRQLIADALVALGLQVGHITSSGPPTAHTITAFARISGDRVSYRGLL